jgi:hypothetical protein
LDTLVLASPEKAFTPEIIASCLFNMGTIKGAPSSNAQALDRLISLSKEAAFHPEHLRQIFVGFAGKIPVEKVPEEVLAHPILRDIRGFSPNVLSSIAHTLGRLKQPIPWLLDAIAKVSSCVYVLTYAHIFLCGVVILLHIVYY